MSQLEYNRLKEWLNINDNLNIIGDKNRSIVTNKDINIGDIIIRIPDNKLIDNDKITNKQLFDYSNKVNSINSLLAIYLMDNENNYNLKPYYDILPKDISNFFYYNSDKIHELIKTSNLKKSIDSHQNYLSHDEKLLKDFIGNRIDKYYYYRLLVGSRVFSYTKNGKRYSGLVPYVDMLNHSANPNCTWYYNDSNKCFEAKATKNIQKGGEIFDSYGNKTNTQYYLYYGFVLPNIKDTTNVQVDNIDVNIDTSLEFITNKIKQKYYLDDKNAKKRTFEFLYNGLKNLPTKKILAEYGANNNIIELLAKDKDIYKKLLINYL